VIIFVTKYYVSLLVLGPSWLWSYGSWIYNPVHGEMYNIMW